MLEYSGPFDPTSAQRFLLAMFAGVSESFLDPTPSQTWRIHQHQSTPGKSLGHRRNATALTIAASWVLTAVPLGRSESGSKRDPYGWLSKPFWDPILG